VTPGEDITTPTTETLLESIVESGPTCRYGEPPEGERHHFLTAYNPTAGALLIVCESCGHSETIA
jgi:hypothetical protein